MTIKNGDLPAMPNNTDSQTLGCMGLMNTVADYYKHGAGLTKREMFAMTAMQGLLVNMGRNGIDSLKQAAQHAACAADELLAELERLNVIFSNQLITPSLSIKKC